MFHLIAFILYFLPVGGWLDHSWINLLNTGCWNVHLWVINYIWVLSIGRYRYVHVALSGYVCEVAEVVLLLRRKRLHVHNWHRLANALLQEHLVDVPAVVVGFNDRLERGSHPLVEQVVPAELAEPFVLLNVLGILDSPRRVSVQQAKQQVLHIGGEKLIHLYILVHSVLQHFVLVIWVEGRVTAEHLVDEGAEAPPIDWLVMPGTSYNFRGHVFWCPTEWVSLRIALIDSLLGKSKICNFEVPVSVQKDILGFQVSIDDPIRVKAFQGAHQLSCIEFCSIFRKTCLPAKVIEKLSTVQEIHNEVQLLIGLEGIVKVYDEGTLNLFHDFSFDYRILENCSYPSSWLRGFV